LSAFSGGLVEYADSWLVEPEPVREARVRAADSGLESASPSVAALLTFLAASVQAQAVVEVGTGTGVSGAALLAGMTPGGILTSIDIEAEYQRYAREAFSALGHESARARLIAGRALDVLPRMSDGAYDMVVVDTDRSEYPAILTQAKRLLRIGGLIAFMGVGAEGLLFDPSRRDAEASAVRDAADQLRSDEDWIPALLTQGSGLVVACLTRRD
jgi:predicted O-methyltransferase YrrM